MSVNPRRRVCRWSSLVWCTVNEGQAVRVFTGAAIPDGADTIIIQENVDPVAEENGINITVRSAEPVGRYIRPAGLDVTKGQIILSAGTRLSARNRISMCRWIE